MFFQFEADFVESLRCIPMAVRYKLDTCGVKLKLHHWNHLPTADRLALVAAPCNSPAEAAAYRSQLRDLVQTHLGETPADLPIDSQPDWLNEAAIPETVLQNSQAIGVSLTLAQWISLAPVQRFALIKLSRSNHENHNFLPALKEFALVAR